MALMDAAARKRLAQDLSRLSRTELDQLVDEVRSKANTTEQGAAALAAAFGHLAASKPLLGVPVTTANDEE